MCTTSQRAPKYHQHYLIRNHGVWGSLEKSAFFHNFFVFVSAISLHLASLLDPITLSSNPSFCLFSYYSDEGKKKIKTEKKKTSSLFNDVKFEHLIYCACMCATTAIAAVVLVLAIPL